MKIQCLQKREGGSTVKLGKTEYRFLPDPQGRHVCEVIDQAHIDRFLAISEGYLKLADEGDTATAPEATTATDTAPAAASGRKAKAKTPSEDQPAAPPASEQGDDSGPTD